MYENIEAKIVETGVGLITLNRPTKKNALSIAMRDEISACLDSWEKDASVRAVIFTGAGDVFCAGFDLKEFGQPGLMSKVFESSAKYHRLVWKFPKPTICAINGAAMGGGFDLTTLLDIRITVNTATFGHPEIKFGAPPLFTPLRWIVGDGRARDLCLTGRRISADEALRFGLVSEVVEPSALMNRALHFAKMIIEAPDGALTVTKKYMVGNCGKDFEQSFRAEHDEPFRFFIEKAPK